MLRKDMIVLTATDCMEAFRANQQHMTPKRFWGNVENGKYWFATMCPGTKRRTVEIYTKDFIDFMHSKGVKVVYPFESEGEQA